MNVYADTNVYVDLFEDRKSGFHLWGEFAAEFFQRVRDKEYTLVISDWVYDEIRKVMGSTKRLQELVNTLEEADRIHVERTKEDEREAARLSKNYPDALHVVLAKKADAVYLVTRDLDYFAEFRDLIEIRMTGTL